MPALMLKRSVGCTNSVARPPVERLAPRSASIGLACAASHAVGKGFDGLVITVATGLSLYVVVRGMLSVPIAGSIPLFMLGVMLLTH